MSCTNVITLNIVNLSTIINPDNTFPSLHVSVWGSFESTFRVLETLLMTIVTYRNHFCGHLAGSDHCYTRLLSRLLKASLAALVKILVMLTELVYVEWQGSLTATEDLMTQTLCFSPLKLLYMLERLILL